MRPQQCIYRSATIDGTRWGSYKHRPGDIFTCTPPKCGTTWVQTIVASLLWPDGNFPGVVMEVGPWFDGRINNFDEVLARLEAQTHRRYIKTHTPADGIPILDTASYIVVGRDGRDAFMSFANHMAQMRADVRRRLNAEAAAQGIESSLEFNSNIHEFFDHWLAEAFMMRHIATWWELRSLPNVLLVHYSDLKADLDYEMRRIAGFLNINISAAQWPGVVDRCTFDRMRADADKVGKFASFERGAQSFLFKGTNGRWREVLTESEIQRYLHRVDELLPAEAAHWLEHGSSKRSVAAISAN